MQQIANADVVRKVMGHSTAGMTRHYVGIRLEAKRQLTDGVAALVARAKQSTVGVSEAPAPN